MLSEQANMPPSLLQQDQTIWAYVHFSAENIGIFPSTEKD